MKRFVFLLEEPSAKEMLQAVLSAIFPSLPEDDIQYVVFQGKQDLEKHIQKRLQKWRYDSTRFLVMRDQDSGDCKSIKKELVEKVEASGKKENTIVRIACRELESFYLGDLKAVEKGLEIAKISKQQNNKKYRNPDRLENACAELKRLTGKKYQKMSGSRTIASHLKLDGSNTSKSFNVLIFGIKKLMPEE